MANIHPTSSVDSRAIIGEGVEVGAFSIIHPNVKLGNRVKIGNYCELGLPTSLGDGSPLEIGDDALIRSHSIFYESSKFGPGLTTGHSVIVRENTTAGLNLQIGTSCELQGDISIGDYVRFQSSVFVGKKTKIGNFVWILPYVIFTNDPTPPSDYLIGSTVEDFATIAAGAIILPGLKIGHHSLVAAASCVTKDVLPHTVVAGVPANTKGKVESVLRRDGSFKPAYPWTNHFRRGYPPEIVSAWENLNDREVKNDR